MDEICCINELSREVTLDHKAIVLAADGEEAVRNSAKKILKEDFHVLTADSGKGALEVLEKITPQLLLLGFPLPDMKESEILERLRENRLWKRIPVIFLISDTDPELLQKCFLAGAADFIVKPVVPLVMRSRVSRILELFSLRENMEKNTRLVEQVSLNSILTIAHTIDAKDAYTSGHSRRVAGVSGSIARRLGWSREEVQNLYYVALLHDIGKIGVPDTILNKPGKLSREEFAVIMRHPVIGGSILEGMNIIKNVADGALYHHERYDGHGYPYGLRGEEIPLCARIIGIADTFDAMTSDRVYRKKMEIPRVMEEFLRCGGLQFDPELASLFVIMLKEGFSEILL